MQDSIEEGLPEYYRNAVEVLEWGARIWKDLPKSDRGAIFEPSFIRGVKRLHLKSQMKVRVLEQRYLFLINQHLGARKKGFRLRIQPD